MEREAQKNENTATSKGLVLLVKDNAELRIFLWSTFSPEYRIVEVVDGMEGCGKTLKLLLDIIINDMMIPEKDGTAITRELCADMATSYIPIVLLTTKSSIKNKPEGLEYGAGGYTTKSFSATYLRTRMKNSLVQR